MDCTNKKSLKVVYGDFTLGVHGDGFDYIFSYAQGGLESMVKNGYEWLYRCPKPTFWRALTDNDRGSKFQIKSGSWLAADMFMDCKDVEVIMDGVSQGKPCAPENNRYGGNVSAKEMIVRYTYETITNPATTVNVVYTVDVTGKIKVDVHYAGVKGLPQLPAFGMRFIMPTLADKYMYQGLSGETYPDRKAGAVEGIYEVKDLSLTPYLVPQECGMHMDTDWVEVSRHTSLNNSRTDSSVQTLRIEKTENAFAFSCLPYTAEEIENATHHEELPPARRTVLCVYGAVRGVGGIDSWGSDVEEAYHISAEEDITYSFAIC
nr:beta-galactosidase [uncultured bacterium]